MTLLGFPWKSEARNAAYEAGQTHYIEVEPCRNGHFGLRRVKDGQCQTCNRASVKKWRSKTGYKTDPEYLRKWRAQNPDLLKIHEANRPEHKLKLKRIRNAERRRRISEVKCEKMKSEIMAFYIEAQRLTEETGIPHEVDHIIPINGKTMCGLHVPSNLRVITQEENRRKGNRLEI